MPRKKEYRSSGRNEKAGKESRGASEQRGLLVFADELPLGARVSRHAMVDLRDWLGRGVDTWVDSMIVGWKRMLNQGAATQSLSAYASAFKCFLEFLVVGREAPLVIEPSQLRPLHITQFVGWLEARGKVRKWGVRTIHTQYSHLKQSLVQLQKMKVVANVPKPFFPSRPFAFGVCLESRYSALSDSELSRLAKAIRADLTEVHHGRLKLRASEAMTGNFLIIAMRTGGNATPLMELSRTGTRPGLLPGMKVVGVMKHRAKKVIGLVFAGQSKEESVLIPTDAAAVLERTLEATAHLVGEAPPELKDRVWLFRAVGGSNGGKVSCIDFNSLSYSIKSMVKRRALLDDQGEPLHVNVTRLRKSFGKRAFLRTNGDVVATANLLGNVPKITESHYLNPDAELMADAAGFMASELTAHLRGDGANAKRFLTRSADSANGPSAKTPLASCTDTLHGEHAPKDGTNHCDKFVMCLFCPSFAVVGDFDELWRLFSFQRYAKNQLEYLDRTLGDDEQISPHKQLLRRRYRAAIPFIDSFTVSNFGAKLSLAAKSKAETELHSFWALQMSLSSQSPMERPIQTGD